MPGFWQTWRIFAERRENKTMADVETVTISKNVKCVLDSLIGEKQGLQARINEICTCFVEGTGIDTKGAKLSYDGESITIKRNEDG